MDFIFLIFEISLVSLLLGNALLNAYYLLDKAEKNVVKPDSNHECKNEASTEKIEKILEEEYESSGTSNTSRSTKKTSNSSSDVSVSLPESPRREPCSFTISISPPLPALGKPVLSSDISSVTTASR